MTNLAENLWLLRYPLKMLGADLHRNVTVIRLSSGDLVIHSTGPFALEDAAHISSLGKPRWMLDAMLRHDTFAKRGKEVFPDAAYLAPEGFSKTAGVPTGPLLPPPPEWAGEIEVLRVDGVPGMEEHAVFHRPSRTLIVADLLFNFGADAPAWTRLLMLVAVGKKHDPGMARSVRMTVKDDAALRRSLAAIGAWDFDRIIVGHGDVVEAGGKRLYEEALHAVNY